MGLTWPMPLESNDPPPSDFGRSRTSGCAPAITPSPSTIWLRQRNRSWSSCAHPAAKPGPGDRRTPRSGSPVRPKTSVSWLPSGARWALSTSQRTVRTRSAGWGSLKPSRARPVPADEHACTRERGPWLEVVRRRTQFPEPGQVIVRRNGVSGDGAFGGGQQQTVEQQRGIDVRILGKKLITRGIEMHPKQVDLFLGDTGPRGGRSGQRVHHPRQSVAPVGGLAQLPSRVLNLGQLPRLCRGGRLGEVIRPAKGIPGGIGNRARTLADQRGESSGARFGLQQP